MLGNIKIWGSLVEAVGVYWTLVQKDTSDIMIHDIMIHDIVYLDRYCFLSKT